MRATTWLASRLKDFKAKADFWKETAIIEFTEQVVSAMKARGLKRTDLASTMGKSKAHVTQLLQGPNMTFGTAAELALSVGMRFRPLLEEIEPATNPECLPVEQGDPLNQALLMVCASRKDEPVDFGPYEFVWTHYEYPTNGRRVVQ